MEWPPCARFSQHPVLCEYLSHQLRARRTRNAVPGIGRAIAIAHAAAAVALLVAALALAATAKPRRGGSVRRRRCSCSAFRSISSCSR